MLSGKALFWRVQIHISYLYVSFPLMEFCPALGKFSTATSSNFFCWCGGRGGLLTTHSKVETEFHFIFKPFPSIIYLLIVPKMSVPHSVRSTHSTKKYWFESWLNSLSPVTELHSVLLVAWIGKWSHKLWW